VKLEQNYRSTQHILDAAHAVIEGVPKRAEKQLWTDAGAGEKVMLGQVYDEQEEALAVISEVNRLTQQEGLALNDIAVLYRTNAQSRALAEAMVRQNVPYKLIGGVRFYERREIKDALAYLRVISNPTDTVNLRRILNVPKRGIGDRAEACIAALAERERVPFVAALGRPQDAPGIATRSVASARRTILVRSAAYRSCGEPTRRIPAPCRWDSWLARWAHRSGSHAVAAASAPCASE